MNCITLTNGVPMPAMAIGTNWMDYKELYPIVKAGLLAGFRAIDTARDYGNEHIVGAVIKDVLAELNMTRSDIFITTKIGNDQQKKGNIHEQVEISLKNLQTEYIDLWLMHWPYPDYYITTYKKMEEVYKKGQVLAIGMANCNVHYLTNLYDSNISVKPHCVQFEYHPMRTAVDIVKWCKGHNIAIQAYSPLCRMIEPIKKSSLLREIAINHGKTIGQIILRWHFQQNIVPVIKTTNPNRMKENSDIFDFNLSNDEMDSISSLDENYKFHLESVCCPGY